MGQSLACPPVRYLLCQGSLELYIYPLVEQIGSRQHWMGTQKQQEGLFITGSRNLALVTIINIFFSIQLVAVKYIKKRTSLDLI